jgi:hypothetical protein
MCKKGLGILIPIQKGQKMAPLKMKRNALIKINFPKNWMYCPVGLGGFFFVWKEINTFRA